MTVDLTRLVKPLEWASVSITKEHKGLCGVWLCAWGVDGQYEIHVFDTDPTHVMLNGPDIVPTAIYMSVDLAQAAANADHAARVLAALDTGLIEELVGAAHALKTDMLERAECGIDTISGEQYRVVNAGNGAWTGFCATFAKLKGTPNDR